MISFLNAYCDVASVFARRWASSLAKFHGRSARQFDIQFHFDNDFDFNFFCLAGTFKSRIYMEIMYFRFSFLLYFSTVSSSTL